MFLWLLQAHLNHLEKKKLFKEPWSERFLVKPNSSEEPFQVPVGTFIFSVSTAYYSILLFETSLSQSAIKCQHVLNPLDLVRYRLALSSWALQFYDDMVELVNGTAHSEVKSESDGDSLSPMAQGNRCGNRALSLSLSQYNSKRCFTEAIVLHTHMHGFMGLAGGSVTFSTAPQQLAFTTLYSFMKYILTCYVIPCHTMEMQTSNSIIYSQKCHDSCSLLLCSAFESHQTYHYCEKLLEILQYNQLFTVCFWKQFA